MLRHLRLPKHMRESVFAVFDYIFVSNLADFCLVFSSVSFSLLFQTFDFFIFSSSLFLLTNWFLAIIGEGLLNQTSLIDSSGKRLKTITDITVRKSEEYYFEKITTFWTEKVQDSIRKRFKKESLEIEFKEQSTQTCNFCTNIISVLENYFHRKQI